MPPMSASTSGRGLLGAGPPCGGRRRLHLDRQRRCRRRGAAAGAGLGQHRRDVHRRWHLGDRGDAAAGAGRGLGAGCGAGHRRRGGAGS